ncbi:hypothetical protein ABI59_01245 [Acidobacteria bacterium Mor1]|nr:hypothetical protein ABI59_01245 [Acidobacteria bacterium Mor1]
MPTELLVSRTPLHTWGLWRREGEVRALSVEAHDAPARLGALVVARPLSRDGAGNWFLDGGEVGRLWLSAADAGGVVEGRNLPVRIALPARGDKEPRVRRGLELPGRFLVARPGGGEPRVSRKIQGEARERLIALLAGLPERRGWIARAAAAGAAEADLVREAARLDDTLAQILRGAESAREPRVLWELPPAQRWALGAPAGCAVVEGERDAGELVVEAEAALARRVRLPSGGALVFDAAEALTAVDVDGGASTPDAANREAVVELSRQLRLRNLQGTVVMDLAGTPSAEDARELLATVRSAAGEDPVRRTVVGIVEPGLLLLTRSGGEPALEAVLVEDCPRCGPRHRIRPRLVAEKLLAGGAAAGRVHPCELSRVAGLLASAGDNRSLVADPEVATGGC